ncbi:MAG: GYD domain-containing protein, partial [Candidatus Thorarchaeota archaeon]
MPIFIVLAKYTTKGVQEIKDAPERYEAAQKIAKSVGAEIKSVYYTMGRYDFVSIIEAPSIEAAMKGLFMLGAGGI